MCKKIGIKAFLKNYYLFATFFFIFQSENNYNICKMFSEHKSKIEYVDLFYVIISKKNLYSMQVILDKN